MIRNMGNLDRIIRFVISATILLLVAGKFISGDFSMVLLIILAVVLAGTSALGTCPLYLPFGFDSHVKK